MQIPEHIEKQRQQGPTFWCGQVFCGHETLKEAAQCWEQHCAEVAKMLAEFKRLEETGEGYQTTMMGKIVWMPK